MTTESHVSHRGHAPPYVSDRPRPAERDRRPEPRIGRDRAHHRGRVPRHDVRAARPGPVPADRAAHGLPAARAGRRLRPVQAPHVLQVVRDQPQLQAQSAPGRRLPHPASMEAGIRIDGKEVEIGPPPGIGRISWLAAPFGPDEIAVLLHADRRTVTAAIEIEGPGVGLRDSEDQEALVDRFGTLLKHVANGDGFVTRLQMLARTLPADPDAHAKDVAVRGDERHPAGCRQSYDQLQSMVSTSSEQHRAYLVACMHYSRELAAEAQAMARAARPQGGRQARPGRGAGRRHGARADRHLLPAPGSRHPGTAAAGSGPARLPRALDVRPGPPDRPHPGDDQAQRLAGRTGRHGADVPPGEDPRVLHPRALVPLHGLGEGMADDPGRRQLPRAAPRPHPGRHPHGRRHDGPRTHRDRHRADADREDERRRGGSAAPPR